LFSFLQKKTWQFFLNPANPAECRRDFLAGFGKEGKFTAVNPAGIFSLSGGGI
jgi:hypothetical protein